MLRKEPTQSCTHRLAVCLPQRGSWDSIPEEEELPEEEEEELPEAPRLPEELLAGPGQSFSQ